jgi:glycosyltransferase involved in cell wall biosynthesis
MSVCVAVMAKNEAHVIARCLASVKPLVDAWVLMDTGSSDATCDVVRDAMRGVPGEVFARPWRHFGPSRTECFELARGYADYTLLVDADDTLEYPEGAQFPPLTESGYFLMTHVGPLQFPRLLLAKSALPWRFEGRCHELAVCDGVPEPSLLEGMVYRRLGGGARDHDPGKYLQDAALLEEDLRADPSNRRNVFLLARSYHDAGDLPRALAHFERRVMLGGWEEEVFYAAYSAARVREAAAAPRDSVVRAYLEAWRRRPSRAEPLYALARFERLAGRWGEARSHAAAAAALPFPKGEMLFVNREVYEWRALDELAGTSFGLRDFSAARDANRALLASGKLPPSERARVAANLALCGAT